MDFNLNFKIVDDGSYFSTRSSTPTVASLMITFRLGAWPCSCKIGSEGVRRSRKQSGKRPFGPCADCVKLGSDLQFDKF